ncbi:MAG: RluA family pseudouridine synthase, partial [Elainella sp.]
GRSGLPTGTGDCCAPKLLHWAALNGWKPLTLAEFWWGRPEPGRIVGEFYAACEERCQPLLGFLLSGLAPPDLPILYEDDWLLAIDKPAGLLSVPGRSVLGQDSAVTRLNALGPVWPVHRLDQDTSGLLLLARDRQTQRLLSQQFQQRQVNKRYEALLSAEVTAVQGLIDLPLWADPADRPYQKVDWQRGKPSQTEFRQLEDLGQSLTRLELTPLTGRTHQLRVHCAHPQGLNAPIWGDRLYGAGSSAARLHLHAKALEFIHPHRQESMQLRSEVPF